MKAFIRNICSLIGAVVGTNIVSIVMRSLKGLGQMPNSLYEMIVNRGPIPYFIIFFTCYIAIDCLIAVFTREEGRHAPRSMFILPLFPFILGAIGTLQGINMINRNIASFASKSHTMEEILNAMEQSTIGKMVAYDPLILGVVATFLSLAFAINLWRTDLPLFTGPDLMRVIVPR